MPDNKVKANEREFGSKVVSWIDEFIRNGKTSFEQASADSSQKVGDTTLFPDVKIWLNREAGDGFCIMELKTPATRIDDPELLENAAIKAREMNAGYFVTWNMRETVIWGLKETDNNADKPKRLKNYTPLSINNVDDLRVETNRILLKARALELIEDLNRLYRDKNLYGARPEAEFFVDELKKAVEKLYPYMKASLNEKTAERSFHDELITWTHRQGIIYSDDKLDVIARQMTYRLLGKILFYFTLRKFYPELPVFNLQGIAEEETAAKIKEYFNEARNIDFQAVFEEDLPERTPLSLEAVNALTELLTALNEYNFSSMAQDVIGAVFEKLIPPEERHTLGQYFTNENLVDLVAAFCVRDRNAVVMDPACGTGTFLLRSYDRLKKLGVRGHGELIQRIWGIDRAHFPAELATINLFRQDLSDYANFPRVLVKDFFDVNKCDSFEFPQPKQTGFNERKITEKLPQFDAIVGNFPFIRQEQIERHDEGNKKKLTQVLAKEWKADYGELFENGGMKLSGQADIYAYMYIHATSHIKEGGLMGFITSNSWLDVAYGYHLQRFLLNHFKIIAIVESRCENWFTDAAVNTVFTILEKCGDKKVKVNEREENTVKFVQLKTTLSDIVKYQTDDFINRWNAVDAFVNSVLRCELDKNPYNTKNFTFDNKNIRINENKYFTVKMLSQKDCLDEIEAKGQTVKWGRYLRAPQLYFDLLEKCRDKFIPINEVADIRRGYTTGVNEFFYMERDRIDLWNIEEKFLVPIIKSFKELDALVVEKDHKTNLSLFSCDVPRSKLRRTKAYNYIKNAEDNKITKNNVSFSEVPSVQGRKEWYIIPKREPWDIFVQEHWSSRFFMPLNEGGFLVDKRLYEIKAKIDKTLLAAMLNSTISILFLEISGRVNLGEGALDLTVYEFEELLIPKIELKSSNKVIDAFKKLMKRPVKTIFDEVKMKDRQAFDATVLEALGLDPKEYLKPLYETVTSLVRERLDLAKQRKTVKKAKRQKSFEQVKEYVIKKVMPDGVKEFPKAFIDAKHLNYKTAYEVGICDPHLKLGKEFMGRYEILSEDIVAHTADSIEEAKFAVYAQDENSYLLRIPKDKQAVKKAVKEYEQYVKDIKKRLFEEFIKLVAGDYKTAENLTEEIAAEFGLVVV